MRVKHHYQGECNFTYEGTVGEWAIFLYRSGEYCAYLNRTAAQREQVPYETGNTLITEDGNHWEWVAGWYMTKVHVRDHVNPLINMDKAKLEWVLIDNKLCTESHGAHAGESVHF